MLLGRSDQRFDVFWKAGTAVAAARVKKLASDACVAADSLADHVHVRSDDFAQVGDVVHEADAGGEHAVRGVFGHLGRGDVHEDYPEIVQQEGAVQPTHQLFRALALDSDHYAVGAHEVFDGAAFFQKLGIGSHVEFDFGSPAGELLPHDLLNPARRAYRNGALGDQQRIFLDCRAERTRHFEHVAQVGVAVLVRRGSYGDEYDLDAVHAGGQIGLETQPSRLHVLLHDRVESGLVDRNPPVLELFDFRGVRVDADHLGAHFRKTGARDESDIPASYHCYSHFLNGF